MAALAVSACGEAKNVTGSSKSLGEPQRAGPVVDAPARIKAGRLHGTGYGYTNICLVYDEATLRPSQIAAALKVVEASRDDFATLGIGIAGFSVRNRNRGAVLAGCLKLIPAATAENTLLEIYHAVDGVLHSDISRGQYNRLSVRPNWRDLSSISLDDFTRFIVKGQLAIARNPGRHTATK
jgi:hypothetical protein